MATTVLKSFNTHNRRFKPGTKVTREDLAGSAHDFDDLQERGFISEEQPEPDAAAPADHDPEAE